MRKVALAFAMALALVFVGSCKKTNPASSPIPRDQHTLVVDEYLLPLYDNAIFDFPLLFKKKYDQVGRFNELDFSFENTLVASYSLEHDYSVVQNGLTLYLLKVGDPTDTGVKVILNGRGKAVSCHIAKDINDIHGIAETEYFFYKNDRIWYIKTVPDGGADNSLQPSYDTVYFDTHGNPSRFGFNTYQYNYTKKVDFQYYIDDQMESSPGYYICQYLGYFPEVTSPPNLRIHVQADEFSLDLLDDQFDPAGRMISYQYSNFGGVVIAWHLRL